jgi:hypothetical protein
MTTYHTSAFYSPVAKARLQRKKKKGPGRHAMQVKMQKGKKYRRGCGHASKRSFIGLFFLFLRFMSRVNRSKEPGREQ